MTILRKLPATAAIAGTCAVLLGSAASAGTTLPDIGIFEGVAGIGTANGDVGPSPIGNKYVYVTTEGSTYQGPGGVGGLGLGGETNGSELTTISVVAKAGDLLDYYFNYVTSDGTNSYIEYAYAILNNLDTNVKKLVFTARTNPNGVAVPGFGLPPIEPGVTLTPSTVDIIDGKTNWAELGGSSGDCFGGIGAGCGQTGWINSKYTIQDAGNYSFTFGVFNWGDTALQSGLAIAGLKVGDTPIDPNEPSPVPLPAAGWLMLAGLGGLGALSRKRKAA
jgi:hypothetical protein